MSKLTVTEKYHWKKRTTKKIDRAIDRLWAQETGLKGKLASKAQKSVREKYPDLPFSELDIASQREKELDRELTSIRGRKAAIKRQILLGMSHPSGDSNDYRVEHAFNREIEKLESIELLEVMESDPVACQISKLEREKDELLDTVWLATSNAQVKALWTRFNAIIGDEPTLMQKEAIEMTLVGSEEK